MLDVKQFLEINVKNISAVHAQVYLIERPDSLVIVLSKTVKRKLE